MVVLQHNDLIIDVEFSSMQLIHCVMVDKHSPFKCTISWIYGLNTIAERKELWDQLRATHNIVTRLWLILGDFNTILNSDYRLNGAPVHVSTTIDFQDYIDDIGLGCVPRCGCLYSWCNKRNFNDRTYSHIDWALGNA